MGKVLPLFAPPEELGQIAVTRNDYQVMSRNGQIFHFPMEEWREADKVARKIRALTLDDPEFDPELDELLNGFVEMNRTRAPQFKVHVRDGVVLAPPGFFPKPPGRNSPCACGSGKKFKKCCEGKED